MRLLLIIAVHFFYLAVRAQTVLPNAETVLEDAVALARKENKKVLVIAQASWCSWCRKMDASLSDPSIKHLFDENFVVSHITAYESKGKEGLENPGAVAFLGRFGGKDAGLPYWIIFDSFGERLADSRMPDKGGDGFSNTGCPASAGEVAHFIQVLKKTTCLKESDLQKITTRFRRNEQ